MLFFLPTLQLLIRNLEWMYCLFRMLAARSSSLHAACYPPLSRDTESFVCGVGCSRSSCKRKDASDAEPLGCSNFYERRRARVSLRNPSRGYLEFKNFQIIFRMRLSTQNIKIIAEYISLSIYSIHKKKMVTYETTSDQFS